MTAIVGPSSEPAYQPMKEESIRTSPERAVTRSPIAQIPPGIATATSRSGS